MHWNNAKIHQTYRSEARHRLIQHTALDITGLLERWRYKVRRGEERNRIKKYLKGGRQLSAVDTFKHSCYTTLQPILNLSKSH